jgi:short-subunit dehydrogenase
MSTKIEEAFAPRRRRTLRLLLRRGQARKRARLAGAEDFVRDANIRVLIMINNAGLAQSGGFVEQSADAINRLVTLNITALTRLAAAIAPRLAQAGEGSIVNIGSIVGLAPEFGMTVYGATKAYVLFLSQGLSLELTPKGSPTTPRRSHKIARRCYSLLRSPIAA